MAVNVQVLYFAFFRERIGSDGEDIVLDDNSNVADLLRALEDKHPIVAAMRGRYRVAQNHEMVGEDSQLNDGDELALIPPVAGGSGHQRHARIYAEPLRLERTIEAVSGAGMGGIVTFVGQVRDHNEGHDVVRLEYEAYEDMATAVMAKLCESIEAEVPGARLAVEHRVGVLAIGEIAVCIAAAAPHRAEAFKACRMLIDMLKEEVPIWKKEVAPDGEEWIGMGP